MKVCWQLPGRPLRGSRVLTRPVSTRLAVAGLLAAGGVHVSAPGPSGAAAPAPAVTLAAVGDILLDRGVARELHRRGRAYPFERVAPLLRSADLAFGNLECPLSRGGHPVPKPFVFRGDPAHASVLKAAGFDLLSVANNHTLDYGRSGLEETLAALRSQGLLWCGAGPNGPAAEAAAQASIRGLRVAFVGFCDFVPEGVFLREDRAGIAISSEERVRRAVGRARTGADVVVASFHWGVEFQPRPSPRQSRLAITATEAGADLILGHHPHVLQGLEVLRRGKRKALVAYSMGNFVFDSRLNRSRESALFRFTLSRRGVRSAEILPMRLEGSRPVPAAGEDAAKILRRMAELSGEHDTRMQGSKVLVP